MLRDNWWIHNPVPTGTVEMAYLSNPREAALLATEDFRQQVALAIRDGIEHFDPQIAVRHAQLIAWQRQHPGARLPATRAHRATPPPLRDSSGSALPAVVAWLTLIAALAGMLRWRRPLARALAPAVLGFHRVAARRRRQQLRLRRLTAATEQRWSRYSVYDELSL